MSNTKHKKAAKELLSRRVSGTKNSSLPEELKPKNIEDALAIHQEMINIRKDDVTAWKCLLPISDDKKIIAPIFKHTVQKGEQCLLIKDDEKAKVEPEIVFVLNQDLNAKESGYSDLEIEQAIGSAYMALELMQQRFSESANPSFPEMLADCLVNQGLFIGPQIDKDIAFKASAINLSFKQTQKNGDVIEQSFDGVHPNKLPQLPVFWAINFMSKRGVSFKKGDAFTTGSYAGIVEVEFDQLTKIEYSGIGSYEVIFEEIDKSL